MLNEPETTELINFLEDQSKDQKEDASTKNVNNRYREITVSRPPKSDNKNAHTLRYYAKALTGTKSVYSNVLIGGFTLCFFFFQSSDYNHLKGIATLGLNVALFSNTVADMKNFYDMKEINDSTDVNTVLWLLRLSFCFQVCVAILAILMYMINRNNEKGKKKKELTKREQRSRFHRSICYGLSLYQMLYLTTLFCLLIITTFQIIASIWSASLGIELKSAMKPNGTTAKETAIST